MLSFALVKYTSYRKVNMLVCAYCGKYFVSFRQYKFHLKIFHNKRTIGDRLVCAQDSCPLDYLSIQALQNHIERHHSHSEPEITVSGTDFGVNLVEVEHDVTASVLDNSSCVQMEAEAESAQFITSVREEILLLLLTASVTKHSCQFDPVGLLPYCFELLWYFVYFEIH